MKHPLWLTKAIASAVLVLGIATPIASSWAAEEASKPPPAATAPQEATVNINTASAAELAEALVGVGAAKAQAIVAYREAHGPFTDKAQLLEVKGIGPAILDKNASRIGL